MHNIPAVCYSSKSLLNGGDYSIYTYYGHIQYFIIIFFDLSSPSVIISLRLCV